MMLLEPVSKLFSEWSQTPTGNEFQFVGPTSSKLQGPRRSLEAEGN